MRLVVRALTLCAGFILLGQTPIVAAQPTDNCPLGFTATLQPDGSVTFHWSGFGGAEGYQVFGHLAGQGTTHFSAMMPAAARDATVTFVAPGNYTFWVVAFHSGTVVASSCERTLEVPPVAQVPFFASPWTVALALVASLAGVALLSRRKRS